ncbi:tetratricopeptide repeat protein [Candidatus Fermentibacterales bacterium]|nr:tetratricopeptide repeat protein [Candidatus Fermentibacterales bacterium]
MRLLIPSLALLIAAVAYSVPVEQLTLELRCETGRAYLQQGLLEQARTEFLSALEIDPGCGEALLGMGRAYCQQGNYPSAETYYRRFLELYPEDPRGVEELSGLLTMTGRFTEALDSVEGALELDPSSPALWLIRAEAALGSGDTLLAEQSLGRLVDSGGQEELEARVMLSSVLRVRDEGAAGRDLLMPAIAAGYAPAFAELARIYLGWGDYMRAVDAINSYLMISPGGEWADSASMILEELARAGEYIPPDTPGND